MEVGVRDVVADDTHVSLNISRPNPRHVRSVRISVEPDGLYMMDCFGPIEPGTFRACHISGATGIIEENLATVFGQLTGIESLHHHHF